MPAIVFTLQGPVWIVVCFAHFVISDLLLLHKERKLLGNSWRWEGGVASRSEMEGLQGRILNYTRTKGRSHGGHFLRPPAPQVACDVSCRWCPCYISFAGNAFQFLIWKQPKSLAALFVQLPDCNANTVEELLDTKPRWSHCPKLFIYLLGWKRGTYSITTLNWMSGYGDSKSLKIG